MHHQITGHKEVIFLMLILYKTTSKRLALNLAKQICENLENDDSYHLLANLYIIPYAEE